MRSVITRPSNVVPFSMLADHAGAQTINCVADVHSTLTEVNLRERNRRLRKENEQLRNALFVVMVMCVVLLFAVVALAGQFR